MTDTYRKHYDADKTYLGLTMVAFVGRDIFIGEDRYGNIFLCTDHEDGLAELLARYHCTGRWAPTVSTIARPLPAKAAA